MMLLKYYDAIEWLIEFLFNDTPILVGDDAPEQGEKRDRRASR